MGEQPKLRATAAAVVSGRSVKERMRPTEEGSTPERESLKRAIISSYSGWVTWPRAIADPFTCRAVEPRPVAFRIFQMAPLVPPSEMRLYRTDSRWRWKIQCSWGAPAARRSRSVRRVRRV